MAKTYDNELRGALFKNDERSGDNDPHYSGSAQIGGQQYWLNAWIKESQKDGRKYMSLSFKPKQTRQVQAVKEGFDEGEPPW